MSTAAQTLPAGPQETFWRTLQTFSVTRVVIAMVLLVYLSINAKKGFWILEGFLYKETCGIYLVLAVLFTLLAGYCKRRFLLQTASQIATDITVISMLYVAAGGAKSGLAILYLFPLAGGAILAPLLLALFFVSIVTLVLLLESGYQLLKLADDASTSQVGLYGAAFFAAVYVINRLAARLIKQEKLALQRGQDLQVQEAINRLVIADTGDGILVVGRDSTVFTANPAAERMLGLAIADDQSCCKLTEIPSLMPIADAFFAWAGQPSNRVSTDADAPAFVVIKPGDELALQGTTTVWGGRRELAAHLKLRFATVSTTGLTTDRTVIFLQDVSEIENQAQQLKLASMGRLTASIAHEVRNPLSAISYAAALMGEETSNPAQARLVTIVGDNVTRLNRMIEDILKLSRRAQLHGEPVPLSPLLAGILEEFQETHGLKKGMLHLSRMEQYRVRFDPLHLREVIVNLLSNALRYASGRDGSIRLHLVQDAANRLELHVQDDGPMITQEVRAHLFEPFYTTSSKGTGLGLYVARELCLNNGAMLDYEYRVDPDRGFDEANGRFVITFAIPDSN
ncbi:MAG: two-component sensor histidine kinase [Herminiimonas sp.]|nr:two-component sensor histidine kinase [Herminiimonas sp.]